jgi:hypothetical protein
MESKAIFALTFSCLKLDDFLVTEAARMALCLRLNKSNTLNNNSLESSRTFWVIYAIEKELRFQDGTASVGLMIHGVFSALFHEAHLNRR